MSMATDLEQLKRPDIFEKKFDTLTHRHNLLNHVHDLLIAPRETISVHAAQTNCSLISPFPFPFPIVICPLVLCLPFDLLKYE